jgi:hypothetical protein
MPAAFSRILNLSTNVIYVSFSLKVFIQASKDDNPAI